MTPTFLTGVFLEILSGIVGTVGKQLVGLSARDDHAVRAKVTFVIGLIMTTVIGAVLDAIAYMFAPQSIVAPLIGLQIAVNVVFAPVVLKETVTAGHLAGTGLVAIGATVTAIFGPHQDTPLTVPKLRALFFRWQVYTYGAILTTCIAFCIVLSRTRPKGVGDKTRGISLGLTAGAIAGNMFFIKCTMALLSAGLSQGDWTPWQIHIDPYVMALLGIAVAIGNVPFISTGLQEYEAVFMVTLFAGCSIIVACVSADVVLLEMRGTDLPSHMAYWCGVAIIICGLFVLQNTPIQGIHRVPPAPGDLPDLELHADGVQQKASLRKITELQAPSTLGGDQFGAHF